MLSINFNIKEHQIADYLVKIGHPQYDKVLIDTNTGWDGRDDLKILCKKDILEEYVYLDSNHAYTIIKHLAPNISVNKFKQSEDDAYWLKNPPPEELSIYFEPAIIDDFEENQVAEDSCVIGKTKIVINGLGIQSYVNSWMNYFGISNKKINIEISNSSGIEYFDGSNFKSSFLWGQIFLLDDNILPHFLRYFKLEAYISDIDIESSCDNYAFGKGVELLFKSRK